MARREYNYRATRCKDPLYGGSSGLTCREPAGDSLGRRSGTHGIYTLAIVVSIVRRKGFGFRGEESASIGPGRRDPESGAHAPTGRGSKGVSTAASLIGGFSQRITKRMNR
jgi:hypothetical protein